MLSIFASCKKQKVELSFDKYITLFTFSLSNNPGVLAQTTIGVDTINIAITPGTPISNLAPLISFVGKSISPSATASQNFTNPVNYTVTAQDGSTKTYVVVVQYLSSTKSISSFVFKAADNPGVLTKDVVASIKNDTIIAIVPPGTDLSKLVPNITYSSHTISPANETAQDFNGTVGYTLSAADLSTVIYKVITGSPGTVYFGDGGGYIYALDAITGHVKWKYLTGAGISATPTLYKNMLIVGSGDSYAYALDTAKGKLIWKAALDGGVTQTPDVANDMVYIAGQSLFALNANTGNQVWSIGYQGNVSVTVSGGIAYVKDGSIYYDMMIYNALTGAQLPANGTSYLGLSNPAVINGLVYVQGNESMLQVFTAPTLNPVWTFPLAGQPGIPVQSDPTVSNGMVYFCGYDANGIDGIYALDAGTGAKKWYFPGGYQVAPLVQNGTVWITDVNRDGVIRLNAQTGQEQGRFGLSINTITDPFMANNTVYETDNTGGFYAFDPYHGVLKWQFAAAGPVSANPLFVDPNGNVSHPGSSGEQN